MLDTFRAVWLRCPRSSCGTGCYRPGFVTLSHGSRSFYHKSRPAPQSPKLENFRGVAASSTTRHLALFSLQLRIASVSKIGHRLYSQSSTLPTMAEVKWTGPRVRKTFLDYFAERGHTIGRAPSPSTPRCVPLFACTAVREKGGDQTPFRSLRDISPLPMCGFLFSCASLTCRLLSAVIVGRPSQ
jgi:hypothetical protein